MHSIDYLYAAIILFNLFESFALLVVIIPINLKLYDRITIVYSKVIILR